jgi:glycosyl-4,4'-diaponeurosporenoate acyltransferase
VLVQLSTAATVIVDVLAWLVVHLGVAWAVTRLDPRRFDPRAWLFRERALERGGRLYQRLFRIESWKGSLPDGARLFRRGFRKKQLAARSPEYLARFRVETCRGELAHWIVVACAPLFFLWNPPWVGLVMIAYALLANLPCILAQRYNRLRLGRVLRSLAGRADAGAPAPARAA